MADKDIAYVQFKLSGDDYRRLRIMCVQERTNASAVVGGVVIAMLDAYDKERAAKFAAAAARHGAA